MEDSGTGGYQFAITGYAGFGGEILRLRNANRSVAQTAAYLNWRYADSPGAPEPKIIWARDAAGRSRGMAALIFRPFWLNGELQHVAVLGDISLDSELRGKGLGRCLLKFMTDYLDQSHPERLAMVIPNDAAERSLTRIGWATGGRLVPYVFVLNPEAKLPGSLKGSQLAVGVARAVSKAMAKLQRWHLRPGYSLSVVDTLDDSFDAFWKRYPKAKLVLSDRGIETLSWRYMNHPQNKFSFAKLEHDGRFMGYHVYERSGTTPMCSVYDFILSEHSDLPCLLALFVKHCVDQGGIDTIRLLLGGEHPYRKQLWKLGFIPREDVGVFQLHGPKSRARLTEAKWFLTYGDKDI
ncbi:MAG: GNAT family N-acetyltransferase [Betaproteobacteria bacterium]|nr:MAG: GNAT family N-acetyltransferase [Betaproteobacteria bacterium]